MTPTWFTKAHAELGCDALWEVVMFEAFNQFPHNQHAKPWSPEDACMGNFSPAFDQQPGIAQARAIWFETSALSKEQRQLITESLEKRGLTLTNP